jgi:hypothetical protein
VWWTDSSSYKSSYICTPIGQMTKQLCSPWRTKANDFLLPQSDFASLCSEGLDFHLQMFLQHHV